MKSNCRVMFTGVSGVGKTTLAKWASEYFNLPFISGSYSDLVKETKNMSHQDMINQDAETVFRQDMQLLSLRNKEFSQCDDFITDRSFFDSAAYFINKLSHRLPQCDIEHALECCKLLLSRHCTHLIFIPYSDKFFRDWVIEDNNKRILSKYYQYQVSQVMYGLLKLWGYKRYPKIWSKLHNGIDNMGTIDIMGNKIKILVLDELNLNKRKDIIKRFLM